MTNKEAIEQLSTIHQDTETKMGQAVIMAIKALELTDDKKKIYDKGYKDGQKALAFHLELCKEEQEPCEDCISRQAVLEGKVIHQSCDGVEIINSYAVPVEYIEQLPSIQPKPKTDALDKIRAEIADLDDANYDYEGYYKAVTDALKIIDKYKADNEIHCNCTDADIAKSFIEDVEAVKDLLPRAESEEKE